MLEPSCANFGYNIFVDISVCNQGDYKLLHLLNTAGKVFIDLPQSVSACAQNKCGFERFNLDQIFIEHLAAKDVLVFSRNLQCMVKIKEASILACGPGWPGWAGLPGPGFGPNLQVRFSRWAVVQTRGPA